MKIAIVTGAGGNLGEAVVKKLLAEGYAVKGTISPKGKAPSGIQDNHFEATAVDLTDEAASSLFVSDIVAKHGRIDVAVLTAGGFAMGKITDTPTSAIRQQLRLNVETTYNVARPVFNQMLQQKSGKIFLIGSRPGSDMHLSKGMAAYGLSKSLIFRLAELMNDEAKGTGVVTHVIAPSTIDTPQNRESMPDADTSKWVRPEAIADIISFYSTSAADVIREPVIKTYNNA